MVVYHRALRFWQLQCTRKVPCLRASGCLAARPPSCCTSALALALRPCCCGCMRLRTCPPKCDRTEKEAWARVVFWPFSSRAIVIWGGDVGLLEACRAALMDGRDKKGRHGAGCAEMGLRMHGRRAQCTRPAAAAGTCVGSCCSWLLFKAGDTGKWGAAAWSCTSVFAAGASIPAAALLRCAHIQAYPVSGICCFAESVMQSSASAPLAQR